MDPTSYRDTLPNRFADDNGVKWFSHVLLKHLGHRIPLFESVDADGKPVVTKRFHLRSDGRQRQLYLHQSTARFLLQSLRASKSLVDSKSFVTMEQANALGFYRDFLARHSRSKSKIRKLVPRPHPALDGVTSDGLIRTETKRVWQTYKDRWSGEQRRRRTLRVRWMLSDLMQIKNATPPSPDLWILGFEIAKSSKPYGLTKKQLQLAVRAGRIEAVEFAVNEHYPKLLRGEGATLPAFRLYYCKANVMAEAARVAAGKRRPKHERYSSSRGWRDPKDGRLFWRHPEAIHKAGVSFGALVRARPPLGHCKYLPGNRAIEAKQIPNDLFGAGRTPQVWVYFDGDLTTIWKAKHGAKRPRRSVPTGNRTGPKQVHDPAAAAELVTEFKLWKTENPTGTLKEFAAEKDLDPLAARRAYNAHYAALSRRAK